MKWSQVTASPRFQEFDEEKKELVRNDFFTKFVAPDAPQERLPELKLAWDEKTKGVADVTLKGVRDKAVFANEDGEEVKAFNDKPVANNDPQEKGFLNNSLRLAGDTVNRVAGGIVGVADDVLEVAENAVNLGGFRYQDDSIIPEYLSPKEWKKAREGGLKNTFERVENNLKTSTLGGTKKHTPEKIKNAYKEGRYWDMTAETFKFAGESGIESLPYMLLATVSLPALAISEADRYGNERAANKGKGDSSIVDTLEALPFALGASYLERFGAKGIANAGKDAAESLGKEMIDSGFKHVIKSSGKAGAKEAGTEFFQEGVIEYIGTRFGTDAKMDALEAIESGAWGALAGGISGTAMATVPATAREIVRSKYDSGQRDVADYSGPKPLKNFLDEDAGTESTENEAAYNPEEVTANLESQKVTATPDQIESTLDDDIDIDSELAVTANDLTKNKEIQEAIDIVKLESMEDKYADDENIENDTANEIAALESIVSQDESALINPSEQSKEDFIKAAPTQEIDSSPSMIEGLTDIESAQSRARFKELGPEKYSKWAGGRFTDKAKKDAALSLLAPNQDSAGQPSKIDKLREKVQSLREEKEQEAITEIDVPARKAAANKNAIAKEKHNATANIDTTKDSLLVAAARRGGLNMAAWESEGLDSSDMKNRSINNKVFGRPSFRVNGGMTPDDLAELANEYGYGENLTASDAIDLISNEMAGRPSYNPVAVDAIMAQEAEQQQRDLQDAEEAFDLTEEQSLIVQATDEAIASGVSMDEINSVINEREGKTWEIIGYLKGLKPNEERGGGQDNESGTVSKREKEEAGSEDGDPTVPFEGKGKGEGQAEVIGKDDALPDWLTDGFDLESQTEGDIKQKDESIKKAEAENRKADDDAEAKRKADLEANDFVLSGSNSTSDIAASLGQGDIFASSPVKTDATNKAKPATVKSTHIDIVTGEEIEITGNVNADGAVFKFSDGSLQSRNNDEVAETYEYSESKKQKMVSSSYAHGRAEREKGSPRELPAHYASSKRKNAKEWYRGWDAGRAAPKENTVFTESAAEKARAVLLAKMKNLNSGLDPETVQAGITLAGYHIEKGARTFSAYSKEMINDLGDAVIPYLKSWYMAVKYYPNANFEGMDDAALVENFDTNKLKDTDKGSLDEYLADNLADITDNRKLKNLIAEYFGITYEQVGDKELKQAQEALELALVRQARETVKNGGSASDIYNALVDQYNNQPNLNVRSSSSVENQAYSTPSPLAFIASNLAGINQEKTVYEPTAGNGMLLINADPSKAKVNELDKGRAQNLEAQGFSVSSDDATTLTVAPKHDSVIMNPPFATLDKNVRIDGYSIKKLDHLIVAKALEGMKDGGKASIIIGANKKEGVIGATEKVFFNWLYGNYNVVDHIEIDGDLYKRQGAGWPVRLITIDGRRQSKQFAPPSGSIARLDNWSDIYEHYIDIEKLLGAPSKEPDGRGEDSAVVEAESNDDRSTTRPNGVKTPVSDGGINSRTDNGVSASSAGDGKPSVVGGRSGGDSGNTVMGGRTGGVDSQRGDGRAVDSSKNKGVEGDSAKPDARRVAANPISSKKRIEGGASSFQSNYVSKSKGYNEGVLVPKNMADVTAKALDEIESEIGDFDAYAMDKLGYKSIKELHDAFMGLQVDTIVAQIYNMEAKGKGVIIADQTGVGKGRQAAGIIRYAMRKGKIPIFVTAKPNLFSDMYEELLSIGVTDASPFISSQKEAIIYEDQTLFKDKPDPHKAKVFDVIDSGSLPDGSNMFFTTYDQMKITANNKKREMVSALVDSGKALFVLDESHNASGVFSNEKKIDGVKTEVITAAGFFSQQTKGAEVMYLSATYAKRPDNMPLYHKTDIINAVDSEAELVDAISVGGVPLQQVASSLLAGSGQLFRRERSFDGINIPMVVDTENTDYQRKVADIVTDGLDAVVNANNIFMAFFFEGGYADKYGPAGGGVKAAGNKAGKSDISVNPFTSTVHNSIRQLMLGIKAKRSAEMAIDLHKKGVKPVIALENTMGSLLSGLIKSRGLVDGDRIDFNYNDILLTSLERSRRISVKDAKGDSQPVQIEIHQLDPVTKQAYLEAEDTINALDLGDLPASPLDYMLNEMSRAGMRADEITGRQWSVDYSGDHPVIRKIKPKSAAARKKIIDAFNSGGLDSLILNVAGATGLSLHASEKFTDTKPRHMIVAQAMLDVNILMQMLGRINRTGQVELPQYSLLTLNLPSEKRPVANTMKKLAQLNANTSSNDKSDTSFDAPDFLNKYGDEAVNEWLLDNPKISLKSGISAIENSAPEAGLANKFTGRISRFKVNLQERIYDEIIDAYNDKIEYLNSVNQNDLIAQTIDLDAHILESKVVYEGKGIDKISGNTTLHKVNTKYQGKPPLPSDVEKAIKKGLKGSTPDAIYNKIVASREADTKYLISLEESQADNEKELDKFSGKLRLLPSGTEEETKQRELISKKIVEIENRIASDIESINNYHSQARLTKQMLSQFKIGNRVAVMVDDQQVLGVVTDVKDGHKEGKGNPYALSKAKVTLMVNSGVRQISLPLSKLKEGGGIFDRVIKGSGIEGLDRIFDPTFGRTERREIRHIATGNLFAGFAKLPKGHIIRFTDRAGATHQGILMPRSFGKKGEFEQGAAVLTRVVRDPKAAAKYLLSGGVAAESGLFSPDRTVKVRMGRESLSVFVPNNSRPSVGRSIKLNTTIRGMIGDFYGRGKESMAKVGEANLQKVLTEIMATTPLYINSGLGAQYEDAGGAAAIEAVMSFDGDTIQPEALAPKQAVENVSEKAQDESIEGTLPDSTTVSKPDKPTVSEPDSSLVETWGAKHTKTDADLYMAGMTERVERDEFLELKELAKKNNGYWSRFGKAGFLFESESDRASFVAAIESRDNPTSGSLNEPRTKYETDSQKKTNADNRARKQAEEAISGNARWGKGTILANGISNQFKEKGFVSLVGQKVDSDQDLANLAEVYRDPRFETFRVFFIKDGKVVGQTGITSRMPSTVLIFDNDLDRENKLNDLGKQKEALGADGFYMLHNHPSGNPQPSRADIFITKQFDKGIDGFLGHVVINGDKYAFIDKDMSTEIKNRKNEGYGSTDEAKIAHPLIGATISQSSDLYAIGAKLRDGADGHIQIIARGNSGIRGIFSVDPAEIGESKKERLRLAATLRRFSRQVGGAEIFAVNVPESHAELFVHAIKKGIIVDAITASVDGSYSSIRGLGIDPIESGFKQKSMSVDEEGSGYSAPTEVEGFDQWVLPNELTGTVSDSITTKKGIQQRLRSSRRKLQDKHIVWQSVQEAIKKAGGNIVDFSDAYNKFTLIEGKIGHHFRNLHDDHVKPLIDAVVESEISIDQLNEYLYAKFAPQRNATIADRDPERPDGGSGMTDAQSQEVLSKFTPEQTETLESLAQRVYAMNRMKLDVLVDSGRMTDETREELLKDDRYVPLKGFAEAGDLVADTNAVGKGFDQAQKLFKEATGRKSLAADILQTAVRDIESGLISAEKNRVGQSVLKLVMDNPNENLWEINPIKTSRHLNKTTGQVELRTEKNYKSLSRDPNVFVTWVEGKPYAIEFKDGNGGESSLARALKNMGTDSVPWWAQGLGRYNRWLSYVNTALSPEFMLINPIRDVQTALVKTYGDFDASTAKDVVKNIPRAMRAAMGGLGESKLSQKLSNPEDAKFYIEYEAEGGKTDYFRTKTVEEMKREFDRELWAAKKGAKGTAIRGARHILKTIENANAILENMTRLSLYMTLRERGVSAHQAATASKNLTVNFNRKGEMGALANSLYLFYNASIQGSHLTIKLMQNPKVQKLLAVAGAGMMALTAYNILMGGDDEDGEQNYFKNVTDYEKERNIIIMWPDGSGRYTKIPLPYGLNVPLNAAAAMVHVGFGQDPMSEAGKVFSSAWTSFSPIGEKGWNIIAPTVIDPIIDVTLNRNFADRKIMPSENIYAKNAKPDSQRYFSTSNKYFVEAAKALNDYTGGNENKSGIVDISPETIEYAIDTITGSAGSFSVRTFDYFTNPDFDPARAPFKRKFYGEPNIFGNSNRYDDHKKHVNYVVARKDTLKSKASHGDIDKEILNSFIAENKRTIVLASRLKATEKKVRSLYKDVKSARQIGDKNKVKKIQDQINEHKLNFNKAYNKIHLSD